MNGEQTEQPEEDIEQVQISEETSQLIAHELMGGLKVAVENIRKNLHPQGLFLERIVVDLLPDPDNPEGAVMRLQGSVVTMEDALASYEAAAHGNEVH